MLPLELRMRLSMLVPVYLVVPLEVSELLELLEVLEVLEVLAVLAVLGTLEVLRLFMRV